MTREWKPGDVAMVTSQYGRPVVAVRCGTDVERMGWAYGDHLNGSPTRHWSSDPDGLHVARPLVVIDPEDREQVERLLDAYWIERKSDAETAAYPEYVSDLQAALREFANPTPPKPEEPTGLGAVVEDAEGQRWVRVGVSLGDLHWRSAEPGNLACFKWMAIDAVRVLSEGVQA